MSPQPRPHVEQLHFSDYETLGGLSFEEAVAMQQAGWGDSDMSKTMEIQMRQAAELAAKRKGRKGQPMSRKQAPIILFEGQDIRVREFKGRDGRTKYAIERPRDKPAALLVELDQQQALKIGRSIHAHGGDFRAAEKSGWSEITENPT